MPRELCVRLPTRHPATVQGWDVCAIDICLRTHSPSHGLPLHRAGKHEQCCLPELRPGLCDRVRGLLLTGLPTRLWRGDACWDNALQQWHLQRNLRLLSQAALHEAAEALLRQQRPLQEPPQRGRGRRRAHAAREHLRSLLSERLRAQRGPPLPGWNAFSANVYLLRTSYLLPGNNWQGPTVAADLGPGYGGHGASLPAWHCLLDFLCVSFRATLSQVQRLRWSQ
mmetsp:Transcript_23205/g.50932  ORF Transcript_23205/g.50932 Transcript_23205/m.50932 type:complete len:225 (+) Transcript_23205:287-961(+)